MTVALEDGGWLWAVRVGQNDELRASDAAVRKADHLRGHLSDFLDAYNFARRLKALCDLTPYEYICKIWTSEPGRFILKPIHQMLGSTPEI